MKSWTNAEIVTLSLEETAFGGEVSSKFDNSWNDENNALHVTFWSES